MAYDGEGWLSGRELTREAQGLAFEFAWAEAHIGKPVLLSSGGRAENLWKFVGQAACYIQQGDERFDLK